MKIKIVTIGKLTLKSLDPLIKDYLGRIGHYCRIETAKEWDEKDFLVLLEETGKSFTSVKFAKWIEEKQNRSVKSIAFAVGPAEGWSEEIKKRADMLLRLSDFTLQHELAFVTLLEQIYRAFTILKGEPYHK